MTPIQFEVVTEKTAIRDRAILIVVRPHGQLPPHVHVTFQPKDTTGSYWQEVETFISPMRNQLVLELPRREGKVRFSDQDESVIGIVEIRGTLIPQVVAGTPPGQDHEDHEDRAEHSGHVRREEQGVAAAPNAAEELGPPDDHGDPGGGRQFQANNGDGDGDHHHDGGNAGAFHRHARVVRLERTAAKPVRGERLWAAIKLSCEGLSYPRFARFAELALGEHPRKGSAEEAVSQALLGNGDPGILDDLRDPRRSFRIDSYERLTIAAEVFLIANAGVGPDSSLSLMDRGRERKELEAYLDGEDTLPYLRIVYERLGIRPPKLLSSDKMNRDADRCREVLERKSHEPCLVELIWSYWHEEAMQAQAMAAISQRFQNRRSPAERDPLAQLEIDPLRPLNHLLWKHAQGETDRLSVLRRAHEYEHEYGFPLHGKAVAPLRPADRRSKFLEAFHNLLYRCVQFYKEDDDTTHVADGFPVLNALKETHYVLSQGAHNQFGDLPVTARQEMLVEQWLLGRPEMREFLGSRPMVAYPEPWMDRVDTVKTLKGWNDVSVVHFHDLAVFGEQLLLSIRWDQWSVLNDPDDGKQWARAWRPQVQGYIHGIRAALGLDLAAEITNSRDEAERYLPPSVHLRRRLTAQSGARP